MQHNRQAAGETAKKTMVIFRDCHKKNNLVITIEDGYMERFYRNYAKRMGWPFTIRKREVQPVVQPVETSIHNWRNPASITERPRPQLGGAFNLALTEIMEGGAQ